MNEDNLGSRSVSMKKTKFAESQIAFVLQQAEAEGSQLLLFAPTKNQVTKSCSSPDNFYPVIAIHFLK